jgi:hypothetical protein
MEREFGELAREAETAELETTAFGIREPYVVTLAHTVSHTFDQFAQTGS